MKSLILATVLVSAPAFAQFSLSNPKVEVKLPGRMTAVQATAHLTFDYPSCGKMNFEVSVEPDHSAKSETYLVKVKAPGASVPCTRAQIKRTYSLQLTSDFHNEKYVLLNPLAAEYK